MNCAIDPPSLDSISTFYRAKIKMKRLSDCVGEQVKDHLAVVIYRLEVEKGKWLPLSILFPLIWRRANMIWSKRQLNKLATAVNNLDYEQSLFFPSLSIKTRENTHARNWRRETGKPLDAFSSAWLTEDKKEETARSLLTTCLSWLSWLGSLQTGV